jgi:peptidoglycan hydrolase-like protein with peptidoglycan-binding domain
MKLITLVLSLALVFVTFCVRAAEPSPRIAELQAGLAELEYDPGPVDGLLGSKTREPIMAFQKDQGLMVDGEYSNDLSWLVDVEMHKRQKEPQRKALLKVSNDELIKLIESVSEDEVRRIWELVPERFADLPIRSVFGKWLPPSGEIVFSIPLRLLLYPPSREGVKQFQTDIGAEVTGELTLRQFHEGHRRWLRQRDTPVHATGRTEIHMNDDSGWARVDGTWILEDEKIAFPVNTSKIDCDRARRECFIADADASIPSPDSDDDSYILHVGLQRHEIISWAAGVIVARRINAICTTEIFTLNSNSKKVYEMVTNNETQECREFRELSVASPQLDKHRIARLAESPATMREFWRKRQKATNSYLNPRVAEGIKQAWKAAQLLRLPGPAR